MSELGSTSHSQDSTGEQGSVRHDNRRATDGPPPGTDRASRTATIQKPAEPLARGEYREQMRRGSAAGADDPADHAGDRGDARSLSADRGKLAEPLSRGDYREKIRQGPPAQADRPDGHADSAAGPDTAAKQDRNDPSPDAIPRAGTQNGDGETAPDAPGRQERSDSKIMHFHSEFKGETLDLYTDGTRWATTDQSRREDIVTVKPEVSDSPPAGAELVEGAGEDASLAERLRRELYEESDDELDLLEKGTNLAHDVFSREPAGSYESTPANHPYISEAQPSAIDPGSMATALFTLGLVIDRGLRWGVRHYAERSRGDGHGSDR